MSSLQFADPALKNYIIRNSLPEIYESLLTGLCYMCPADPLKFLEEKIKEMLEKGHLGIASDTFIDETHKVQLPVTKRTGMHLQQLFGFEEDLMVSSHLYEAAFSFYQSSLMRMCFDAWVKFISMKREQEIELTEKMNMAEQHFARTLLKMTLLKWNEWQKFRKKEKAEAVEKIQAVFHTHLCKQVFKSWHELVQDSKKKKDYFEHLNRGQVDHDLGEINTATEESKDDISMLPKRAALKIFSFLDIADLARCAQVCQSWKIISHSSSLWSTMDFSPVKNMMVDGTAVNLLQKYRPYVIHLNFRRSSFLQWPSFKCISECRNLQDLNLSECASINDEIMRLILEGCPALLYLNLSYTNVTNGTLRMLSRCCLNLQYLSLAYCRKFTDKGLQYLATGKGCHKLIYLDLSGCTQMSVDGFKNIAVGCSELQHLEINDMPTLTDKCILAIVSECQNLQTVSLQDSTHLSDSAFKALAEAAKLTKIKIRGNNRMTDASWKSFCKSSPCLCHIYAADCQKITDISLKAIGSLKNLTVLNVADCIRLSDAGIKYLVEGPSAGKLREVNLTNCVRVSDMSLLRISQRCLKLTYLSLCYCEHLTDSGLELLAGLPSLTSLDLTGTNIQDQGLASLGTNTGIKKLTLSECLWITDLGIQKLCQKSRDLEHLDISHCLSLTDKTIKSLAFYCQTLTSLSIAGCPKMTDLYMQYLTGVCQYLHELDISGCVHITDKTTKYLQNSCKQLHVLNMLYCKNITRQAALKVKARVQCWEYSNEDPPAWFGYDSLGSISDSIPQENQEQD
ncbi:F-box and leucine-rich repeat protein 13 isoform X1 [Acipenser ruthenus]|uniref:F-box and leucine-rich repeat protein 13 isoform X1 n=1 Tax=Acipenser ruthenus TaxID=7906 RepID=UPI00145C1786|nr:F-box and leucine-rich repeat protein 13 isoform X1 [Acipenser ruthenus]